MLPWFRFLAKETVQQVLLRDQFLWRLPRASGAAVALTFDDGPHPKHTLAVLDRLARHNIKATFFVIGRRVNEHPEIVRRIVAEGHGLGNHTFGHLQIDALPMEELARELQTCRQAILDAAGVDTRWFRPPRGRVSWRSLKRVTQLGYRVAHWSKTYGDYQCDRHDLVQRMQRRRVRARDIVLLHDHNPATAQALAAMMPAWRARGLTFSSLETVARDN